MSGISCHVLDTSLGRPAAGLAVHLERLAPGDAHAPRVWELLGRASTSTDGRANGLHGSGALQLGQHRITFETEEYFRRSGQAIFYPEVQVVFIVAQASDAYHVPLLLSPFGYTTYRGS
jgi:5-hydroxyisourate hydrolase